MTESEFRAVITSTKRAVLGAIRAHLSPDLVHSVDDISQEAYMRIYRALSSGKGPNTVDEKSLSSWAYVIARNECFRMQGQENRRKRNHDAASDLLLLQQWTEPAGEEALALEELEELISQLEAPFSETLGMLLRGYTQLEISRELEIPAGTVKSRISRGREKLRVLVAERSPNVESPGSKESPFEKHLKKEGR